MMDQMSVVGWDIDIARGWSRARHAREINGIQSLSPQPRLSFADTL